MTTTLADQKQQIEEIHHQVNFNGGGSVKDGVVDVKHLVGELLEKQAGIITTLSALDTRVTNLDHLEN